MTDHATTLDDIERATLRRAARDILAEGPDNLFYDKLVEACRDHIALEAPMGLDRSGR